MALGSPHKNDIRRDTDSERLFTAALQMGHGEQREAVMRRTPAGRPGSFAAQPSIREAWTKDILAVTQGSRPGHPKVWSGGPSVIDLRRSAFGKIDQLTYRVVLFVLAAVVDAGADLSQQPQTHELHTDHAR